MSAHQQQRASIEAELRKNKRLLQFVLQTQEMLTQPTVVPPAIFKATARLLRPGDFDMVLDERDNARLCGYPCCAAPDLGPRHRIPLPPKDAGAKPVAAATATASGPAPRYRIDVARGLVIDESVSSVHYCSVACAEASLRFRATLSEDPVFLREGFRSTFSAPSSGTASLPTSSSSASANTVNMPTIIASSPAKAAPSARLDKLVVTERSSSSAAPATVAPAAPSGASELRLVRFEAATSSASAVVASSSLAADGAHDSEDAIFAEMARAMERAGMPADQSVERGRRMTSGTSDSIPAAAAAATAADHGKTALPSVQQTATKSAQPPAPRGEIHERDFALPSTDSAHSDNGDAEQMVDDAFFNQSGADDDSAADENGAEEPMAYLTIGASFIQPASFRWSNEDLGDEEGSENGDDDGSKDEDEPDEGDDEAHASRDRVRMSSATSTAAPIMQINVWDHSTDADASSDPQQSQSQSQSQPQPNQQQVYIMPQPARAPPSVMQHHWRAELSPFARCHATIVQLTAANSAVKEFLNGAKWADLQPSSETEDADETDNADASEPMDELDAHAAAEDARANAAFEDAKADNRSVHLSRRGALLAQIRPYAMALCASPLFRKGNQLETSGVGSGSGGGSGGGFGGGCSVFDAIATDLTELVSLLSFNQPVPFLNEPEWRLVALTLLVLLGDRPQCAPALRPRGLCVAALRLGGGAESSTANPSQQGQAGVASNGGILALLRELQFDGAHLECLVDAVKFDY